jgi:hypothetical protein
MADAAATPKRSNVASDEKLFQGFTKAEKTFLLDLGNFLANYPKFGGQTPYEEALEGRVHVRVSVSGPVPDELSCKNICYYNGRPYCC